MQATPAPAVASSEAPRRSPAVVPALAAAAPAAMPAPDAAAPAPEVAAPAAVAPDPGLGTRQAGVEVEAVPARGERPAAAVVASPAGHGLGGAGVRRPLRPEATAPVADHAVIGAVHLQHRDR